MSMKNIITVEQIAAPKLLSNEDLTKLTANQIDGFNLNPSLNNTNNNNRLFKNKSYSFLMSKHLVNKKSPSWSAKNTPNSSAHSINQQHSIYLSNGFGSSNASYYFNVNNSILRRNFLKTRTSL